MSLYGDLYSASTAENERLSFEMKWLKSHSDKMEVGDIVIFIKDYICYTSVRGRKEWEEIPFFVTGVVTQKNSVLTVTVRDEIGNMYWAYSDRIVKINHRL
jgi:hypothetical protein